MWGARNRLTVRYGYAVVSVVIAVCFRLVLDPAIGDKFPFAMMFFAVMVASWLGGFGPAIFANFLGALASARFLVPPRGSIAVKSLDNQVGMVLYLLVSTGISFLGHSMQVAQWPLFVDDA